MTLFHSQQNAPADIPLIRDVILTCRLAGGPSHSWFENIDYVTRADDLEALNTDTFNLSICDASCMPNDDVLCPL